MKIPAAFLFLVLVAALSSCKESPKVYANRLKIEAVGIQNSTLQAMLKNDLKFIVDLDEQEIFFASLRTDLERCREIESELREIAPGPEVSKLEENTAGILLAISKREEQNQRSRDAKPKENSNVDQATMIEALQRTIEEFKESGRDTGEVEQLLSQLQEQEAEQGSVGQTTTCPELDSEGGDKPQPEAEGRSR